MDEVDGETDIGEVEFLETILKYCCHFDERRNLRKKLYKDWRFLLRSFSRRFLLRRNDKLNENILMKMIEPR